MDNFKQLEALVNKLKIDEEFRRREIERFAKLEKHLENETKSSSFYNYFGYVFFANILESALKREMEKFQDSWLSTYHQTNIQAKSNIGVNQYLDSASYSNRIVEKSKKTSRLENSVPQNYLGVAA